MLDRTQSTSVMPLESMIMARNPQSHNAASANSVSMDEDELAEVVSAHVEHVFSCVHKNEGIILKVQRSPCVFFFFASLLSSRA